MQNCINSNHMSCFHQIKMQGPIYLINSSFIANPSSSWGIMNLKSEYKPNWSNALYSQGVSSNKKITPCSSHFYTIRVLLSLCDFDPEERFERLHGVLGVHENEGWWNIGAVRGMLLVNRNICLYVVGDLNQNITLHIWSCSYTGH